MIPTTSSCYDFQSLINMLSVNVNVVNHHEECEERPETSTPIPPESPAATSPPSGDTTEQVGILQRINKLLNVVSYMYNQTETIIRWRANATTEVYLYDFKNVWNYLVGFMYTLSAEEYKYLVMICGQIWEHYQWFMQEYTNLHYFVNHTAVLSGTKHSTLRTVYKAYKTMYNHYQLLKQTVSVVPDFIAIIQTNKQEQQPSMFDSPEQDSPQGVEWLRDLCKVYTKLEGQTPVSPERFLRVFRWQHHKLSDAELALVTNCIESHLGNQSFTHICTNFRHWLTTNSAALPVYIWQFIILDESPS